MSEVSDSPSRTVAGKHQSWGIFAALAACLAATKPFQSAIVIAAGGKPKTKQECGLEVLIKGTESVDPYYLYEGIGSLNKFVCGGASIEI
jgi:hypothetical protein